MLVVGQPRRAMPRHFSSGAPQRCCCDIRANVGGAEADGVTSHFRNPWGGPWRECRREECRAVMKCYPPASGKPSDGTYMTAKGIRQNAGQALGSHIQSAWNRTTLQQCTGTSTHTFRTLKNTCTRARIHPLRTGAHTHNTHTDTLARMHRAHVHTMHARLHGLHGCMDAAHARLNVWADACTHATAHAHIVKCTRALRICQMGNGGRDLDLAIIVAASAGKWYCGCDIEVASWMSPRPNAHTNLLVDATSAVWLVGPCLTLPSRMRPMCFFALEGGKEQSLRKLLEEKPLPTVVDFYQSFWPACGTPFFSKSELGPGRSDAGQGMIRTRSCEKSCRAFTGNVSLKFWMSMYW